MDHSIVEAFVDKGTACATARVYPGSSAANSVYLVNSGAGSAKLGVLHGFRMKSPVPPSAEELRAHAQVHSAKLS